MRKHFRNLISKAGVFAKHILYRLDESYLCKGYEMRQEQPSTSICVFYKDQVYFPPRAGIPLPMWEQICVYLNFSKKVCSADIGFVTPVHFVDELYNLFNWFLVIIQQY